MFGIQQHRWRYLRKDGGADATENNDTKRQHGFRIFRNEEKRFTSKDMCMRLGRGDSYLGSIKRNGMPEKELSVMAAWLDLDEDDERLYVGGKRLYDNNMQDETFQTCWSARDSNELHKMRSDVAELRRIIFIIAKELGVNT